MSEGGFQYHCGVSEGGARGHCGVSEGGYQGYCLVEIRYFKYDAVFLTLFITFISLYFLNVILYIYFLLHK